MSFVQSIGIDNGNVHQMHFLEDDPESLDGTLKSGSVRNVEGIPGILQQFGTGVSFSKPLFTQRTIIPSGETVFVVPGRFTVSDQNKGVLHVQARRRGCIRQTEINSGVIGNEKRVSAEEEKDNRLEESSR